MAKHVETGSSSNNGQLRRGEERQEEDRRDAAGRRMARAATRAAHERDEERESLETDILLDEIDEVLEEDALPDGETDAGKRQRLGRSTAEDVEDRIGKTLEYGLGYAALQESTDAQQAA